MLITHTDLFTPHSLRWRVFRKVAGGGLRERLAFLADAAGERELERHTDLRFEALDVSPVAQLVVDRSGLVTSINQAARTLFGLGTADVGRPVQDLEVSYRPADVRSALEQAYGEARPVRVGRVTWTSAIRGELRLDVMVAPIDGTATRALGAVISFDDVTEVARLEEEFQRSKRQLETAYEELQSTVEELETTNEELHSTNEELETTNEELQSSNEELETMNEELQSTNDELETMNDEQTARSVELDRVNMFLEGILGSLGVGVVVLDRDQRVQVWNANSTDLWGLRAEEAEGQHFLSLNIGFPVERLKQAIRETLAGAQEDAELDVKAVTRLGKKVDCQVRILPLRDGAAELYGLIVLMGTENSPGL